MKDNKLQLPRLLCTLCGHLLVIENDNRGIECEACGAVFPIKNGILDFVGRDVYYGEIKRELMHQVLNETDRYPWKEVIDRYFKKGTLAYTVITDESRADWTNYFPIIKDHTILDVGAGWGTLAVPLSRRAGAVYCLDDTLERVEFILKRAQQERRDNIFPMRASVLDLPFDDESFDSIVLNGVLEWVPLARKGKPWDLQVRALENCRRVLKKNGTLFVGIENRVGFKYILGEPEDHVMIPLAGVLPRPIASLLVNWKRKRESGFRNYTYSIEGFNKLFQRAGFSTIAPFYPIPDYKTVSIFVPLSDRKLVSYYLNTLFFVPWGRRRSIHYLEKTADVFNVLDLFCGSYLFAVGK
jgi:ubiquinone/menaquinone biosynthesis C-methylase UbiE